MKLYVAILIRSRKLIINYLSQYVDVKKESSIGINSYAKIFKSITNILEINFVNLFEAFSDGAKIKRKTNTTQHFFSPKCSTININYENISFSLQSK